MLNQLTIPHLASDRGNEIVIKPNDPPVNIYQFPGVNHRVIGNLRDGDTVRLFRSSVIRADELTWFRIYPACRIISGDLFGWVAAEMFRSEPPMRIDSSLTVDDRLPPPILPPDRYRQTLWFNPPAHKGVDLATDQGTPIHASASGLTVRSFYCQKCGPMGKSSHGIGLSQRQVFGDRGWGYGFGHHVIIRYAFADLPEGVQQNLRDEARADHFVYVMYAHLYRRDVAVGDAVHAGQVIGLLGNSGYSTGPHLHLEVRTSLDEHDELPIGWGRLVLLDPRHIFGELL